jgi:hypothetical protein
MHARELPIPPVAETDARAVELLRVWAAQGKQHVSLAASVWNDPAAWGIFLVDLAKHVSSAYEQSSGKALSSGKAFAETLLRIKQGFDAEWQCATDKPSGHLQD